MQPVAEALELDTVRVSDEGISEIDGRQLAVMVPWSEIAGVEISRGFAAQRPIAVLVIALLLIAFGIYALKGLLHFLIYGGEISTESAWYIAFAVVGIMMIWSLRPKYMLLVHRKSGTRKVIFQTCNDEAEIESFLAAAMLVFPDRAWSTPTR